MSLYGALYSAVSGIQSQSTAIGIISDNVSNINTIGYKAGSQYFSTLVTNSGAGVAYSPGGVRAQNRQLISQQGLVQSSNSPLDLAVSGNGMFVVQDAVKAEDNPTTMYTRAGSFRKDSLGNFVNAAGLYLKAWPLDGNGNIPSNFSSPASLELVNVSNATGAAAATTNVDMGINLDAEKPIFKGSGIILTPGSEAGATENRGVTSTEIMIPNANMSLGDSIVVTTTGTVVNTKSFIYGGMDESVELGDGTGGTTTVLTAQDSDDKFGADDYNASAGTGDWFTIARTNDSQNPIKLKFRASGINASEGTFNSLETLAEAISAQAGFTARVVDNKLYVSAADATEGLTFTNGTGTTNDFVTLLDLDDYAAGVSPRYNTLAGLANLVNTESGGTLKATLNNPTTTEASIEIYSADPTTDIKIGDSINGDMLPEFGLVESGTSGATAAVSPAYDVSSTNGITAMYSGAIKPDFQRTFPIYDSLGARHDITIGFLKVAPNQWKAEIYAKDGELSTTTNLVASGDIKFNGDGTLQSISSSLTTDVQFIWANKAQTSTIDFDMGTAGSLGVGKADGLRQSAGTDNVLFITANGSEQGSLDSVSVDKSGYIIANFSNGQTQRIYKIPLASFTNVDGLQTRNGNAFIQSFASGAVNLKEAATGGVGSISPSSLEASGAELSEELTDMIVAQRAYQASAKVITTADELLDALNRISG